MLQAQRSRLGAAFAADAQGLQWESGRKSGDGRLLIESTNYGLSTGNLVAVSGVGGNTAANASFLATVVDSDHFSLDNSAENGAYAGGGAWSSVNFVVFERSSAATAIRENRPLRSFSTRTKVGNRRR